MVTRLTVDDGARSRRGPFRRGRLADIILGGCVVAAFLLGGCAGQAETPKQVKAEVDFADCKANAGAREATLLYVGPEGDFKWHPGAGVWESTRVQLMACMRAKGYRFYDGPIPR